MSNLAHLLQTAMTILGFVMLCGAMDRHARSIHGRELSPGAQARLRVLGSAALLISLVWLTSSHGSGVGFMYWCMLLSLCAVAVILINTYRPAWLSGRFKGPQTPEPKR